jgi:hypothetical protein
MYPASFTPCRNAATLDAYPPGELLWRNPTTGIADCCARAASGQTTALPSVTMISRRWMWIAT